MSNTPDDDLQIASLAGLYALDALDAEERERFEALLATDPDLRDEVAGYHATAARLTDLSATSPPPQLRGRVLAEVAATRQDSPVVDLGRHRRARRARTWAAAAVIVAVVGAGVTGYVVRGDGAPPTSMARSEVASVLAADDAKVIPLVSADGGATRGRLVVSASRERVVVVSDGLERLADGRTYELWRIDADGGASNAGLFEPDGAGHVERALEVAVDGAVAFAVTDEPDGGSSTPTTPVLLQASIS